MECNVLDLERIFDRGIKDALGNPLFHDIILFPACHSTPRQEIGEGRGVFFFSDWEADGEMERLISKNNCVPTGLMGKATQKHNLEKFERTFETT